MNTNEPAITTTVHAALAAYAAGDAGELLALFHLTSFDLIATLADRPADVADDRRLALVASAEPVEPPADLDWETACSLRHNALYAMPDDKIRNTDDSVRLRPHAFTRWGSAALLARRRGDLRTLLRLTLTLAAEQTAAELEHVETD